MSSKSLQSFLFLTAAWYGHQYHLFTLPVVGRCSSSAVTYRRLQTRTFNSAILPFRKAFSSHYSGIRSRGDAKLLRQPAIAASIRFAGIPRRHPRVTTTVPYGSGSSTDGCRRTTGLQRCCPTINTTSYFCVS